MKAQSIFLISFCITSILSTACDDTSMTTSALCTANTTCEWKAKSTGTCGDTTTNSDGDTCTEQTSSADCSGNCVWTATEDSGSCAAGTTLTNGSACSTATTSTDCNNKCTWTEAVYECAEKSTTTEDEDEDEDNTSGNDDSSFGLKNSILIILGLFLF